MDDELVGKTVLSLEVQGPWGHFRRIEGNIVKQTYRVIPRTTVAGLLAAMVGAGRDTYYEAFRKSNSAIATELTSPVRTMNMPQNNLSTNPEALSSVSASGGTVRMVDPSERRQQFNYQVLVDPSYRIDIWTEDEAFRSSLRETLEAGESYYVPSLGLSEHLAQVEFLGEHEIEAGSRDGNVEVDSTVIDASDALVPTPEGTIEMERSPAFMETVTPSEGGGRRTTGYVTHAYNPDAAALKLQEGRTYQVDDRTVMFA